ncbi:hypothetical protein D9757_008660 [Collybiopsis confluens]|uniref:Uncharacterized protein n=1 Tax=Collybiopsis confluens TaxID=2823264 RepID=A0A8H5H439_9AGAR|nr:hypothetical protein D9757_008660 [Collybiopsis confluens]
MAQFPASYSLPRFINAVIQCAAYGAYAVIFGFAIWILPRKFNVPAVKMFFFPAIIALFFFATLNIVLNLVIEMDSILDLGEVKEKPNLIIVAVFIVEITFTLSDVLGDMILFCRVYAVWGSRKEVLFPLLAVLLIAKAFELIVVATTIQMTIPKKLTFSSRVVTFYRAFVYVFAFVNAFANLSMTVLIASRVLWISRRCGLKLRWYHRTIAVITESGIIYPLFLIIEGAMITTSLRPPSPTTIGVISMGLGPTLIAVRVGSGSAYDHQSLRVAQSSHIVLSTDIGLESQHYQP